MVWVLRETDGSAQISTRVLSGPMPARESATATLTLAGNPRIASRAEPSNTRRGAASPSTEMPLATRWGAPASPFGGLRVSIVTSSTAPSLTARTASRPSSAPVGTRMRPPCFRARSTRSMLSMSAPTDSGMKMRPRFRAGSATERNRAAGRHSRTMPAASAIFSMGATGTGVFSPATKASALPRSRADTAERPIPGTLPRSTRRATSRPMAPRPAIASVRPAAIGYS